MPQSETVLIAPRRHFLVRAFGLTAAGATLQIPLQVADTPEQRVTLQLEALARALGELYPEHRFTVAFRRRQLDEVMFVPLWPGDIIATVKVAEP
jgi:hypothetical protein